MFGKAQALVEKYPVLFTLGLLISSILRGTTLAAHSRGGSAKLKKKERDWFFCVSLSASFYSFSLHKMKERLKSSNLTVWKRI